MSVTYTPNLGLGLQLDKTEYLNWDVITENWQKIDDASAGGGGGGIPTGNAGDIIVMYGGITQGITGQLDKPNQPYIRATGSQGIRCGFTPSSSSVKYVVKFADWEIPSSGWSSMYGGHQSGTLAESGYWGINTSQKSLFIGNDTLFSSQGVPTDGYHEYTTTITSGSVTVDIDSQIILTESWSGSIECPVGLCCAINTSGGSGTLREFATVNVYGFKIYENDVLVRDFVPALGANDRPAFYDNVSQTYFYSETGTDFVYVPAETEG